MERSEQPRPKLGENLDGLGVMLAENEALPERDRLTLKRIYDLLRREGYEGSYDAVRPTRGSGCRRAGSRAAAWLRRSCR